MPRTVADSAGLGKVPECLVHGLVMPVGGRMRVVWRASSRRVAAYVERGQHRAQRMPSATPLSRVGELGEVVEQAAALVGGQRGGRDRMGGSRDGG